MKEAADSGYLSIDRRDFTYKPEVEVEEFRPSKKISYEEKHWEPNPEWEEERRQKQEYWAAVKYAKSQLYDYYGTACHFCPDAYGDLASIESMSPDEILREASRNRLI